MRTSQAYNPYAALTAAEIMDVLIRAASEGLNDEERRQLSQLLDTIVPALVELRDAGFIELTARVIVDHSTLDGLMALSIDTRLSQIAREKCIDMRDRVLVDAVHRELLRRQLLTTLH